MELEQYRTLARVQDRHWFYDHRREAIRRAIRGLLAGREPRDASILDFGAGMGANVPVLREFGRVTCVEREPAAREHLARSWPELRVIAPEELSGEFDLVVVSYVLYHRAVEDPAVTLRALRGRCRPGAILVSLEPAFASLERQIDRECHGARRFTLRSLRAVHREAGWAPVQGHYLLPSLFPVAWLVARLDGLRSKPSDQVPADQKTGSWVDLAARAWLATADTALSAMRAPFGVGVMVVSRSSES